MKKIERAFKFIYFVVLFYQQITPPSELDKHIYNKNVKEKKGARFSNSCHIKKVGHGDGEKWNIRPGGVRRGGGE
jgi:hypothetical protein